MYRDSNSGLWHHLITAFVAVGVTDSFPVCDLSPFFSGLETQCQRQNGGLFCCGGYPLPGIWGGAYLTGKIGETKMKAMDATFSWILAQKRYAVLRAAKKQLRSISAFVILSACHILCFVQFLSQNPRILRSCKCKPSITEVRNRWCLGNLARALLRPFVAWIKHLSSHLGVVRAWERHKTWQPMNQCGLKGVQMISKSEKQL